MDKVIFFLGGKDLEMETIQGLLEQNNIEFVNKNLSWGEASIDQYLSQIKEKVNEGYVVYGIELANPESIIIDNYISIDHHGIYEGNPSSLEQVCKIIGHEMSREEKLIAANDARYIPGMKGMEATEDEIRYIRKRDRMAQGVTEEEENQAEKDILSKEVGNTGLVVVATKLEHFSPIVDRLEYECLLVYSDTEFTYYGKDRDYVKHRIESSKLCICGAYSGGGNNGFYGGQFNKKDAKWLEHLCCPVISKHVFLFPFLNSNINLSTFHTTTWPQKSGNWERTPLNKCHLDSTLYNELNYFYPHLHNILYDSSNDSCVRHFEYLVSHEDKFIIQVDRTNDPFELDVDSININFYSTGVAILSIGVSNTKYESPNDILKINQFGRRVFHPFANDISFHMEGAHSLVLDLSRERIELMNSDTSVANSVSNGLKQYINSSICCSRNDISPILDDRMFVLSWYKNDKISFDDSDRYKLFKEGNNHFWYRYVFVDTNDPSCQNAEMRAVLLDSATYPRWQDWGTLYGISRYSFVMLTSSACPCYLLQYFETEYVKMAELVLVQRASILKYTKALQECTNTKKEFEDTSKLSAYYEEYLHFLNNYRFTNISAQDQAIELYDILCDKIHIKEDSDLLDQQFNEVQEFMELHEERIANKEAQILNRLAGWAVPIAITSAIFGFFFHDNFGTEKISDFRFDISAIFKNPGFTWIAITIVLMIVLGFWFKKKQGK